MEIGVVAETISGYFEILELGRRTGIVQKQLDLLEERLTLTEDRYERGVVTSLELYQIQQDVNATRSQLPLLRAQLIDARGRLGILLGRFPTELDLVRADQWFTNFVTSLTAPIFNGGRLAADQAAAQARFEQEAARYARAVLTAFKEVEASLAVFNAQRERHAILADQAAAAQASAESQLRRLKLGIRDYVAYLDALRQSFNVENTRITAERELAVARLNVHRALGGSWIQPEEGA